MKQKQRRCNLETMFGVQEVSLDTQMRGVLDGVPVEPLRRLLPKLFERVRQAGWAEQLKTAVPTDAHQGQTTRWCWMGRECFHSTQIQCPGCVRRMKTNGTGALLAHSGEVWEVGARDGDRIFVHPVRIFDRWLNYSPVSHFDQESPTSDRTRDRKFEHSQLDLSLHTPLSKAR